MSQGWQKYTQSYPMTPWVLRAIRAAPGVNSIQISSNQKITVTKVVRYASVLKKILHSGQVDQKLGPRRAMYIQSQQFQCLHGSSLACAQAFVCVSTPRKYPRSAEFTTFTVQVLPLLFFTLFFILLWFWIVQFFEFLQFLFAKITVEIQLEKTQVKLVVFYSQKVVVFTVKRLAVKVFILM